MKQLKFLLSLAVVLMMAMPILAQEEDVVADDADDAAEGLSVSFFGEASVWFGFKLDGVDDTTAMGLKGGAIKLGSKVEDGNLEAELAANFSSEIGVADAWIQYDFDVLKLKYDAKDAKLTLDFDVVEVRFISDGNDYVDTEARVLPITEIASGLEKEDSWYVGGSFLVDMNKHVDAAGKEYGFGFGVSLDAWVMFGDWKLGTENEYGYNARCKGLAAEQQKVETMGYVEYTAIDNIMLKWEGKTEIILDTDEFMNSGGSTYNMFIVEYTYTDNMMFFADVKNTTSIPTLEDIADGENSQEIRMGAKYSF